MSRQLDIGHVRVPITCSMQQPGSRQAARPAGSACVQQIALSFYFAHSDEVSCRTYISKMQDAAAHIRVCFAALSRLITVVLFISHISPYSRLPQLIGRRAIFRPPLFKAEEGE